jgi:hypothetical protein
MTVTARAVAHSGQVRTARAARRAVAQATRAAQVQAWQDERAQAIRAEEEARAARIAARETAIRDHTVDYLLAVAAEREVMEAARRRCEAFRAQAGMAVAGLRSEGLTRADLVQLTGLSSREITALLQTGDAGDVPAREGADGPGTAAATGASADEAGAAGHVGVDDAAGGCEHEAVPHGGPDGGAARPESTVGSMVSDGDPGTGGARAESDGPPGHGQVPGTLASHADAVTAAGGAAGGG